MDTSVDGTLFPDPTLKNHEVIHRLVPTYRPEDFMHLLQLFFRKGCCVCEKGHPDYLGVIRFFQPVFFSRNAVYVSP